MYRRVLFTRIISRGSSLYFLRCIVTLTRCSRCGWRWLEKPGQLQHSYMVCTHTPATVMGPRALVIQPIDFRTLLLYYMMCVCGCECVCVCVYVCVCVCVCGWMCVAIAIATTDDQYAEKYISHESTGASARTRYLGYKLILSTRLYILRGTGLTSDVITTGYRWPGVITLLLFRRQPRSH